MLLGLRVMIKAKAITRAMLLMRGRETARPVSQRRSCQQQAAPHQKYSIPLPISVSFGKAAAGSPTTPAGDSSPGSLLHSLPLSSPQPPGAPCSCSHPDVCPVSSEAFSFVMSWMLGTIAEVNSCSFPRSRAAANSSIRAGELRAKMNCQQQRRAEPMREPQRGEFLTASSSLCVLGLPPCRRAPSDHAALPLVLSAPCPLPHYTRTLPR